MITIRRQLIRHFLLCGFAICATAYAENITYNGSFTTADNTVSYSITTDGILGVLAQSDILSISFSDTGTLAFSTPEASGWALGGNDLSASGDSLIFDFADTAQGGFNFYAGTPENFCSSPCQAYVTFGDSAPDNPYSGASYEVIQEPSGSSELLDPAPPDQVIATASPEPGTLVMTLGGSTILGLAAFKRRCSSASIPTPPISHGF